MSTQLTIPEWTGGHRLNNGEFLSYAEAVVKAYAAVGFDRLALATVGPQLAAAVNTLATALQREAAFDETNTIAQADATRDTPGATLAPPGLCSPPSVVCRRFAA